MKDLSTEEVAYLAGFLDGDGSINAQLIRRVDYRLGYQIRVSVTFFQKSKRNWFLLNWQKRLGVGTVRTRNDNISEFALVGTQIVRPFLEKIRSYTELKTKQIDIILEICNKLSKNQSSEDFIQLCEKVDLLEDLNDSKKRKVRAAEVKDYLAGNKN